MQVNGDKVNEMSKKHSLIYPFILLKSIIKYYLLTLLF